MPTVLPAGMCRVTPLRAQAWASLWYLKDTFSKSTLPCSTCATGRLGWGKSTFSSSTWAMRPALARERVSSKNTLEIIIREFITWST